MVKDFPFPFLWGLKYSYHPENGLNNRHEPILKIFDVLREKGVGILDFLRVLVYDRGVLP